MRFCDGESEGMGNLDLERALNPWMFDKDGNPTPQAEEQFPDLVGTPGAITTGGSATAPAGVSGQALVVHPATLTTAGQNASQLGQQMVADCQTPVGDDLFATASAMRGWAIGGAVTTAHQTWESQFLTLGGNLITIGQNLQDNASGYTGTEDTNRGHMRALED